MARVEPGLSNCVRGPILSVQPPCLCDTVQLSMQRNKIDQQREMKRKTRKWKKRERRKIRERKERRKNRIDISTKRQAAFSGGRQTSSSPPCTTHTSATHWKSSQSMTRIANQTYRNVLSLPAELWEQLLSHICLFPNGILIDHEKGVPTTSITTATAATARGCLVLQLLILMRRPRGLGIFCC